MQRHSELVALIINVNATEESSLVTAQQFNPFYNEDKDEVEQDKDSTADKFILHGFRNQSGFKREVIKVSKDG